MANNENLTKKTIEVQAPKKIKNQCLHTTEEKECTCIRSKGLVLKKES